MSTSFRPSRHGFAFANRFDAPLAGPAWRAVGLPATWGLCGGMVHAAREAFLRNEPLPTQATVPAPSAPLYRALLRRQLSTLGPPLFAEAWRFLRWTRCRDAELARRTRPQLERARRRLAAGRLVPLGLVYVRSVMRLWENHQVLVYAADAAGTLRLYDPNEPRRDDVTLAPAARPGGPAFEKRVAGRHERSVRGAFIMDWA